MKEEIKTSGAPAAIGPYAQAVACKGELIFVSGQLPIDPATGNFAGEDITSQTHQSLKNIKAILEEKGCTLDNVVKSTVLLKRIEDFGAMNTVYAEYFSKDCPARAAFQVAALPKDACVEIEVVAVKD